MTWTIPGTVLTGNPKAPEAAEEIFNSWFLTGGLVLSQVAKITGLEPYTVQNWVKRGFLPPPVQKKYSRDQLSRIITINMLKSALPMETICGLISAVNGRLDDEGDDTIHDNSLYFYFLRLAGQVHTGQAIPQATEIQETLAGFPERNAGDRERIARVLEIMLLAWQSACYRKQAEDKFATL